MQTLLYHKSFIFVYINTSKQNLKWRHIRIHRLSYISLSLIHIYTDDSGIQTTPKSNRENKSNDNGVSLTGDKIESLATPVQSKQEIDKDEKVMNMLQLILEQQSIKLLSDSDAKFNIQNNKFDELKNEIQEINKRCENTKVELSLIHI